MEAYDAAALLLVVVFDLLEMVLQAGKGVVISLLALSLALVRQWWQRLLQE